MGKSDRFLRFRCLDKRYSSISEPFPLQLFVPSVRLSMCVCVLLLRFPMARLSPASLQPSFVPRAPSQLSIRNITVMNNEHRSRAPPSLMTPSFPTGKNFNQIPTKKQTAPKKKTEDRRCGVADFCDVWLLLVQQQQQQKNSTAFRSKPIESPLCGVNESPCAGRAVAQLARRTWGQIVKMQRPRRERYGAN